MSPRCTLEQIDDVIRVPMRVWRYEMAAPEVYSGRHGRLTRTGLCSDCGAAIFRGGGGVDQPREGARYHAVALDGEIMDGEV